LAPPPDDSLELAVARLRADPQRTAILLDFDGTLAPIVEDPALAAPLAGVGDALLALARRYAVVTVISGRPVDHLRRHLPDELHLVGLYGLEQWRDGELVPHPEVAGWRPVVAEVVAEARRDLADGVGVEDKGLSLTLHVRPRPDQAEVVRRWATEAAARTGLEVRSARMSMELHPPVAVDKGSVTAAHVEGLAAASFIGDDVGDVPAFVALATFAARSGGTAVRAVVRSDELAPELLALADVLLAGPAAVLDLLHRLA
jgi:trehalose 6-phosphate phosphatase